MLEVRSWPSCFTSFYPSGTVLPHTGSSKYYLSSLLLPPTETEISIHHGNREMSTPLITSLIFVSCFFHAFAYNSFAPNSTESTSKITSGVFPTADPPGKRGRCPTPPTCPPQPGARPPTQPRYPPRPSFPRALNPLMPRRPPNNPGPLSSQASVLFITQELKRNITFDPQNYTGTWVGTNYCLFKGYYCDTVPDKNITGLGGIDFNGAKFGGPNLNFARFISFLPDIAIFHVNSNNFSGVISPNIINTLRYFYEIDLSNNGFAGRGFPASVLSGAQLTFVDVRFNTYRGIVSPQVFNFNTDVLFINNNKFSRRIPANFGNTPALYITLANNRFVGPIPRSIGRAHNTLTEVLFLNNRLTGCLPYEIGFLKKATVFDVGGNLLTGHIPLSFGCLSNLQLLNLAHNRFYGPIPESLCALPKAYNFTLAYNFFTQVGPICRRLIRARRLHIARNCIMGMPFQKPAAECATFFATNPSCPRESELSIVPCTISRPTLETHVLASDEEITPAPSPTYAALVKPPPPR